MWGQVEGEREREGAEKEGESERERERDTKILYRDGERNLVDGAREILYCTVLYRTVDKE